MEQDGPGGRGASGTDSDSGASDEPVNVDLGKTLADHVRGVVDATEQVRLGSGMMPLVGGFIIGEIAVESTMAGPPPWGEEQIMAARNLALTTLIAVIQHSRGFADDIEAYRPFAPYASARAAIEAAALAHHLSEPGIGPRARVARVANERLRSLRDERSAAESMGPHGQQYVDEINGKIREIVAIAASLGFAVSPNQLVPPAPTMSDLVAGVFEPGFGRLVYHIASSASHGRVSGLMRGIEVVSESLGTTVGNVMLRPLEIALLTTSLLLAMRRAMESLAAANGWNLTEWLQTWVRAAVTADAVRQQFTPPANPGGVAGS